MKKKFVINPALVCFCFLVSIAGHTQDPVASDLSKENYARRTKELKEQFDTNKSIPEETELVCLPGRSIIRS